MITTNIGYYYSIIAYAVKRMMPGRPSIRTMTIDLLLRLLKQFWSKHLSYYNYFTLSLDPSLLISSIHRFRAFVQDL